VVCREANKVDVVCLLQNEVDRKNSRMHPCPVAVVPTVVYQRNDGGTASCVTLQHFIPNVRVKKEQYGLLRYSIMITVSKTNISMGGKSAESKTMTLEALQDGK
jgi:hypothetical protein